MRVEDPSLDALGQFLLLGEGQKESGDGGRHEVGHGGGGDGFEAELSELGSPAGRHATDAAQQDGNGGKIGEAAEG